MMSQPEIVLFLSHLYSLLPLLLLICLILSLLLSNSSSFCVHKIFVCQMGLLLLLFNLLSYLRLFVTPWTAALQASLSFTLSWNFLKLTSIELVIPANCLILCHPLLLFSIFSSIRVFSSRSALCIRQQGYWSFSLSITPSNEYSGLISLRVDWFGFLAVHGALWRLLQHHNLKATVLGAQPSLWSNSHIHT